MSCPTCGHTLACLTNNQAISVYHCERCGTAVVGNSAPLVYVPKLVERCREYQKRRESVRSLGVARGSLWHTLGIAESINPTGAP